MILRSLEARLLLAVLGSIIVALAIGGTIIHELFKKRLYDDFDRSLRMDLTFQILSIIQLDDNPLFEMSDEEWNRLNDRDNPIFIHSRIAEPGDEQLVHYSSNLRENPLPKVGWNSFEPEFEDIVLFNGRPARAVGKKFYPSYVDGDKPKLLLHVVVAQETNGVLNSLKQLRTVMWQVAAGIIVVLMGGTTLILNRNLKPLDDLSKQIAATPLTGGRNAQFSLKGAPAELDPVVDRLNQLMERVDNAFDRERQFTANAAHELRNPLAGMRSQIELALGGARTAEEYRETLTGVYDIEQGMERVVENLLILARLESGEQAIEPEIVPLTEVLRRGWRKVFDTAEQKQLKPNWEIQNDLPALKTSRNLVSIIVRNLLDNAVDYSPEGGDIKIAAHYDRLTGCANIRVSNTNTHLTEADCEKMFELFWRGETSDSNHRHAGLGLGLCRRILDILEGTLKVRLIEGNHTVEFQCVFPCEVLEV